MPKWSKGLFLALAVAALCSCEGTTPDFLVAIAGESSSFQSEYSITSDGEDVLELKFQTNKAWSASLDQGIWCSITSDNSGLASDECSLTLTIKANCHMNARTDTLRIEAGTEEKKIAIKQEGAYSSEYELASDRTVVVYIAAENSLAAYCHDDINELVEGMADMPEGKNDHLVVYCDTTDIPTLKEYVCNGGTVSANDLYKFTDDADSSDPKTLENVLNIVKETFGSKSYGLVMWSHGDGWVSSANSRYIVIDNNKNTTSNSGQMMDIWDMADAVKASAGFLDFILFDACLMQTVEVMDELKDCCRYMIASPCEIPGYGAPYQLLIPAFFSNDLSDGEIESKYYHYYKDNEIMDGSTRYGAVVSTVDLSQMSSFAKVTKEMTVKYFPKSVSISAEDFKIRYGYGTTLHSYTRRYLYFDMNEVMKSMLDDDDYTTWKEELDKIVVNADATGWWFGGGTTVRTIDLDLYGGIAAYFPNCSSSALEGFRCTLWYNDGGWKEAGW